VVVARKKEFMRKEDRSCYYVYYVPLEMEEGATVYALEG